MKYGPEIKGGVKWEGRMDETEDEKRQEVRGEQMPSISVPVQLLGRDCSARGHTRRRKHAQTEKGSDSASPDDGGHWYCTAERQRRGGWVRSRLYWKEGRRGGGGGTRGAVEVKRMQEALSRRSWLRRGENGEGETEGCFTCVQTWELRRGSAADYRRSQRLCGEIKQFHEAWTANDSSLVSDTGMLN